MSFIRKAFPDIQKSDYKLIAFLLSNYYESSLGDVIYKLYGIPAYVVYDDLQRFNKDNYDEKLIEEYKNKLRATGFYDWVDNDE
ncbi:MAG: hypothetical protein Q3983_08800 [Capnocytophaga sp.]|nr:hypothetical protein [Capnocytophaga sp.]